MGLEIRTQNTLEDLNNHLFEQLERLNDDEVFYNNEKTELSRSKAIADIAGAIINNANVVLNATKYKTQFGVTQKEMPRLLEGK